MICTQAIELVNVSISTSWGSLYVYAEPSETRYPFPQTFTEVNSFTMDLLNQGNGYYGFMIGDYGRRIVNNADWGGICLIRPTRAEGVNATLCITAIGKWK